MSIKLYFDLMSQPSRALYILFKSVKCNFEPKLVDLRKGEHFSDEFAKINRIQRVPVIDHNGFVLSESVAIIKYLSRENVIPDSLFPKDSKQRARVDEFLEWQHIGLRLHTAMFFRVKYLDPIIMRTTPNPKTVEGYERRMIAALEDFNTKWLGQGTPYVTGNNITVADLLAACELEQPKNIWGHGSAPAKSSKQTKARRTILFSKHFSPFSNPCNFVADKDRTLKFPKSRGHGMAGYDPREKFENIAQWHQRVRQHFNPFYDEAHVVVNKIIAKNAKITPKL